MADFQDKLVPPNSLGSWNIGECLGRGAFSGVYKATLKDSAIQKKTEVKLPHDKNIPWVLKISAVPKFPSSNKKRRKTKAQKEAEAGAKLLFWEYQVYNNFLRDLTAIPRRPKGRCMYGETPEKSGTEGVASWRYLALEQLGGTLRDKIKKCKDQTVPSLAAFNLVVQALEALQKVHQKGIVFRDIKPENFMVGSGEDENKLFLVDFGACSKYVLHDGKHIDVGAGAAGTPLYMSIFAHENAPPSRRDDLISLGYMLVWMLNGMSKGLPWEGESNEASLIKLKRKYSAESLCEDFDPSTRATVQNFLESVMNLGVHEDPDYEGLMSLFLKELKKGNALDSICWSSEGRKPTQKSKKASVARKVREKKIQGQTKDDSSLGRKRRSSPPRQENNVKKGRARRKKKEVKPAVLQQPEKPDTKKDDKQDESKEGLVDLTNTSRKRTSNKNAQVSQARTIRTRSMTQQSNRKPSNFDRKEVNNESLDAHCADGKENDSQGLGRGLKGAFYGACFGGVVLAIANSYI